MRSHSVTCYPTQVNAPRFNLSPQAVTRFTYPAGMEGWIDLATRQWNGRESNWRSLDHKSDALSTTLPSRITIHFWLFTQRRSSQRSFSLLWTVSGPDVPTLTNKTDIQPTSFRLTWDLGRTVVRNSSVVYYLDVATTPSPQNTTTIDHLTGLTPEHTYLVYLEVTSFDKTARSIDHIVIAGQLVVENASFLFRSLYLLFLRTKYPTGFTYIEVYAASRGFLAIARLLLKFVLVYAQNYRAYKNRFKKLKYT